MAADAYAYNLVVKVIDREAETSRPVLERKRIADEPRKGILGIRYSKLCIFVVFYL